jgi:hypothetical protein
LELAQVKIRKNDYNKDAADQSLPSIKEIFMHRKFTILLLLAVLLSACLPTGQSQQDVDSIVNTVVAQTMEANARIEQAVHQTLTAQAPLATATVEFTATFEPIVIVTDTPIPLTATNTPSRSGGSSGGGGGGGGSSNSGSTGSAYSCAVVAEKPNDGATFKPGDSFDKSWTIKNTGTQTWGANWEFEYKGGTDISPTGDFLIGQQVQPGQTITLVIEVEVPAVAFKDSGEIFVMTWSLNNGTHFCTPFVAIKVVP